MPLLGAPGRIALATALREDAALHAERLRAIANRRRLAALPDQELQPLEERRLPGAGLAGDDREALGGGDARLAYEGDVCDVELVDHGRRPSMGLCRPLMPVWLRAPVRLRASVWLRAPVWP